MRALTRFDRLIIGISLFIMLILEIMAFRHSPVWHYASLAWLASILVFCLIRSRKEIGETQLSLLHHKRLEVKAWYFESIITYSANIIFTVDSDYRILKFNKGSERAFGLTQAEAVGREVRDLFQETAAVSALLAEVEKEGVAENPGIRIKHSDQSAEIWLQASITRMFRSDKEMIGTVFNCVDITKRRQLELELQEKNHQLLRLSITDGLTGLFNVRHFHEEVSRSLKTLRRYPDRSLSIALLDVDQFKKFNDTKGHLAGDHLLHSLGRILQFEIRQGLDQAFRYGGDEFVLLLPDTKADGAQTICDRVRSAFAKADFAPTGLSIGIVGITGSETMESKGEAKSENLEIEQWQKSLIKRADVAMYTAKNQGGGIVIAP